MKSTLQQFEKEWHTYKGRVLEHQELMLILSMSIFACDYLSARLDALDNNPLEIPKKDREQLAKSLAAVIDDFELVWKKRNRIGGLKDSKGRLQEILAVLQQANANQ